MAIGTFKLPTSSSPTAGEWSEELWQEAYDDFTRPADWLALPTVNLGEEKIVMLHSVYNHDSNFCAFTVTGSNGYTVDWGDGTVENIASNVKANHTYDFNNIVFAGTTTSIGYKQAIVTITPQAGGNLLTANFHVLHNSISVTTSSYDTGWLDFRAAGINFTSIIFGNQFTSLVKASNLQMFEFIGTNNIVSSNDMFANCYTLGKIVSLDTSKVTTANNMFVNCYCLPSIPLLDFSHVTTTISTFQKCISLVTIPFINTSLVTNSTNMFGDCINMINVPLLNFSSLTYASTMFARCYTIASIPLFNLSSVTNTSSMFVECYTLDTVPLFDLHSAIDTSQMFYLCANLSIVPLFNLSSVTNVSSMFRGCYSLTTVPLFNLGSVTNASQMFWSCYSLLSVPLFDLHSVTNTSNMFSTCNALSSVPLFNLSSLTNGSGMFSSCQKLETIPLFIGLLSNVTSASSMSNGCQALKALPNFNFNSLTSADNMFNGCDSLAIIPAYNFSLLTTNTNLFQNCYSNSKLLPTGIKTTFSLLNNKLSKPSLELMFNNLKANVTTQTVTITGNYGADTVVPKTLTGTTSGSAVLTQVSTSSLAIGMLVTGTGISDAKAVTMQGAGINTVTRVAHGLPNGKLVYFATIVTTTGIVVKTPYYVVNATADTFQLSLTSGGAALILTTNGTGTIQYPSFITAITTNTNFTIDVPATATGSVTTSNRLLNTSLATLKGWTVTG